MPRSSMIRPAALAAVLALAAILAMTTAPTLGLGPSMVAVEGDTGQDLRATDIAGRGRTVAMSVDVSRPEGPFVGLLWTTNLGLDWAVIPRADRPTRQSQVTICDGHAVMLHAASDDDGASWLVELEAAPFDGGSDTTRDWTTSGDARHPDVGCLADRELVGAWFERRGSGWRVRLRTRLIGDVIGTPQSFDLGAGTPGRGLALATSSTHVYVAWFRGDSLRLRRFAIGSTSAHTLSSLGTTTLATLPHGTHPEIGADGRRVILAYSDRGDLKVRRSIDRGRTFGAAVTLRDEPFPSPIRARPTSVAVRGERVVIGGLEWRSGTRKGKGLGYRSTNGGRSYRLVSTHSSGRIVATLVRPGTTWAYAEAWDQSITRPDPQVIRFRR